MTLLGVGAIEGTSLVALKALSPRLEEPVQTTREIFADQTRRIQDWLDADSTRLFVVFDTLLGWRQQPGYHSEHYTISPQGVRGTRAYAPIPAAGVLRVDAFGDSFVFGTEMDDTNAWSTVLERAYPAIEVPNYGVGGYGLDQTLLAISAQGRALKPDIVLVGFVPDELRRTTNVYRRFLSTLEPPLVKPRFQLTEGGALVELPTPFRGMSDYRRLLGDPRGVIALGRHDSWYSPLIYRNPLYDYSATIRLLTVVGIRGGRRYLGGERLYVGGLANPRSEAFRLQVALFSQVVDTIHALGAEPLLVFFPDRSTLVRAAQCLPASYQPLLDSLRAHGMQPLDAAEAFAGATEEDVASLFATAHYSAEGNRLVGMWLGEHLQALATDSVRARSNLTPSPPAPHSP